MKRIIVAFLLVLNIGIADAADKTITSKTYVDNQIATKQDKIPAVDTKTVITHTGTAGEIGEKGIYDSNGNYAEQQTSLVTAGDANTGINTALANEFVCIEEDTDGTCLIWSLNSINTGKNLFDKDDPNMQMGGYFNESTGYAISPYGGGDKMVFIKVSPNTTYTIQRVVPSSVYNRFRVGAFNTQNVPRGGDTATNVLFDTYSLDIYTATVTTKSDTTYLGIFCRNSGTVGADWNTFLNGFQVEEGSVATSYEPHRITYIPSGN